MRNRTRTPPKTPGEPPEAVAHGKVWDGVPLCGETGTLKDFKSIYMKIVYQKLYYQWQALKENLI